jgi:hypothetical protein
MKDERSGAANSIIDLRGERMSEPEDLAELIRVLRRVSAALDRLWNQSLADLSGDLAIRLGDASQGVHRALIALKEDSGGRPLMRPSVGPGRAAAR